MKPGPLRELIRLAVHTPAREGTRGLLDIGLGVAATLAGLTQREQLHHLPGEVFVGSFAARVGPVQVNQHGRVLGNRVQQDSEIPQGVVTKQLMLRPHGLRTKHLLL